MSVTRVDLVAATYTNITTQFEALGNNVKFLTDLTDVSLGMVKVGQVPTSLRAITGGANGPAAVMSKPEGSTDTVWAYSTLGGNLYLHGNAVDAVEVVVKDVGIVANPVMGVGITGIAGYVKESIIREGDIIRTTLIIDLDGLNSGAGTTDIIGDDGTGEAWIYQVTAAKNGLIVGGTWSCLETPVTGDDDIDLYRADESTGVEDTAIGSLSNTAVLVDAGDAAIGTRDALTAYPAADSYIYMVGIQTTAGEYSAGIMMLELIGLDL